MPVSTDPTVAKETLPSATIEASPSPSPESKKSGSLDWLFSILKGVVKIFRFLGIYDLVFSALRALNLYGPVFYWIEEVRGKTGVRQKRHGEMIAFYAQFLKPGEVCFDIGANVGNRVAVFTDMGAKVVAIEPQNFCMGYLQKKYGARKNLTLIQCAMGDTPGEMEMMIAKEHRYSSLSKDFVKASEERFEGSFWRKWDATQRVEVKTMDALIEAHGKPAFTKIDVEGFELNVLQGLSQTVAALSFEYQPFRIEDALACVDRLAALGDYEFNYSESEAFTFTLSEWVDAKTFKHFFSENVPGNRWSGDVYARLKS